MELTPWELGKYTLAEFFATVQGYNDQLRTKQQLMLWQAWMTAYLTSYAFHDPKKMPSLQTIMKNIEE